MITDLRCDIVGKMLQENLKERGIGMMARVRQLSYQKKAVLLFSLLISLLILVFLAIYTNSQSRSIKEKEQDTMEQLSVRAVTQFGEMLENMHRISLGAASDKDVLRVLEQADSYNGEENYFQKYPQERKIIQMVLMNLIGEDFRNRSFHVISERNDWLNLDIYNEAYMNKAGIEALSWQDEMKAEKYIKYITPFTEDGYGRTEEPVFSYVRQIRDEYRKLGYIDIQYEKKLLDDIFTLQMNNYPVQVAVYHGGELFYSKDLKDRESLKSIQQKIEFTEEGSIQEVKAGNRKYLVYGADNPAFEMQFCLYVDVNSYMGIIYQNLGWIIVLGASLLCIMILLVTLVSENLYRPIRQLRDSIRHMNYGELAMNRKIEDTDDEIQMLTTAFYDMLDKMKISRNELVEARTRAVRARYEVLQAQINPHFMHNILSVIGLMGYQKDAPEIMDICSDLTKMLQFTTDTGNSTVPLKEEIEHAATYLKLMGYRYLDRLQTVIEVEPAMEEILVPKFILQPIAENCFQHSFANSRQKQYEIQVLGRGTCREWQIQILDNGTGFSGESLEKLKKQFAEIDMNIREGSSIPEMGIGGMALTNTYARLAIYSEGRITLEAGNRSEGGSWVCLRQQADEEIAEEEYSGSSAGTGLEKGENNVDEDTGCRR